MFLNIFIASMIGEHLNTSEHPIWAMINLLVWCCVFLICFCLMVFKTDVWGKVVILLSTGLIFIQLIALGSLLFTEEINLKHTRRLTNAGLFELASHNNIIVFILDHYDYSYLEAVKSDDPTFYNSLDGFTLFDNVTAVYSRSYPANTYLLTGIELPDYHIKNYETCVEKAFEKSSFFFDLEKLGFKINIYTDERFIGSEGENLADNYLPEKNRLNYVRTIWEMLRCSLYFETPYIIKPYFWFYNEFNTVLDDSNLYVMDDAKLYQRLLKERLSIGNFECGYRYIHMVGAHSPYTLNENGKRVDKATNTAQWKGCVNIVEEYLEQMKLLGLYDSATIIITADHGAMSGNGDLSSVVSPILFVKPAYADHKQLEISHAPVSHADLFPTIIEAAGGDYRKCGTPVFSIKEDERRKRIFHYTAMTNWAEKEVVDYEIIGDVKEFSNWNKVSTKRVKKSIYAVAEE